VVEVTASKATIQFSDGNIRKIASSHYTVLEPANPAFFVSDPKGVPVEKARRTTPLRREKSKQTKA
jgi:hypothetical protein